MKMLPLRVWSSLYVVVQNYTRKYHTVMIKTVHTWNYGTLELLRTELGCNLRKLELVQVQLQKHVAYRILSSLRKLEVLKCLSVTFGDDNPYGLDP